jgi:hypothetical protein
MRHFFTPSLVFPLLIGGGAALAAGITLSERDGFLRIYRHCLCGQTPNRQG